MIHADIPSDLTFEQFKALAMREPDLAGNWIYELEASEFDDEETDRYPLFELYSTPRYIFRSLEEAERFMREQLAKPSIYRFVITQRPIGHFSNEHGAQWLYDHNGTMIDRTNTRWDADGGLESIFFGRPVEWLRFHNGDIVEVFDNGKVNLAIVAGEPYPLEWYWQRYLRHGKEYYFDASDEAYYYLLEGPGYMHHVHASTINLMKPRWTVPDDIRLYFEYCLECGDLEDCDDVYNAQYFGDNDIGELGVNKITITYDSAAQCHRLIYVVDNTVNSDNDKRMVLPGALDEAQIARLTRWLNEVMYGRTRLWYLIRDWNVNRRNFKLQPELSLDTTPEQLLK
ncbi:MAG: hypothetical protein HDS78_03345 [Bacteroidales bacterium]|nr:hypothetical protein [Bacteroidales bacterium]